MRNHEDEKEAIRILESVFPELKNCKFEKLDRPDLQSKTHDIGIEVVQAIREKDMKLWSLAVKYWEKENKDKDKRFNEMKNVGWDEETKDALDDGILCYKGDDGYCGRLINKDISVLKERVQNKLNKSNGDGYRKFKENDLFIYCELAGNEDMFTDIMNDINKIMNEYECKFSKIYIHAIDKLYVFDFGLNIITKHEIPAIINF